MHKRDCTECDRVFPAHLISPLRAMIGGQESENWVCPMCALRLINEIHGLPEGRPFHGKGARELHAEALTYVAENYAEKENDDLAELLIASGAEKDEADVLTDATMRVVETLKKRKENDDE
ncbi:hypothetical protein ES705_32278 [subsurface metagenome]